MIVYWAVLWKSDLAVTYLEKDQAYGRYLWWNKVCIHLLPAVSVIINTLLTRGVFIPGHAVYMVFLGLAYMPFNYWGTVYTREPIYFFMPWTDYKTIVNGLVVFCIAAFIQQFVCMVTVTTRKGSVADVASSLSYYRILKDQ